MPKTSSDYLVDDEGHDNTRTCSDLLRDKATRSFSLGEAANDPLVRRAFEAAGREYRARASALDKRMGRPMQGGR